MKKNMRILIAILCFSVSSARPFSLTHVLAATAEVVTTLWHSLESWWQGTPDTIRTLRETAKQREAKAAASYEKQEIPREIAVIAAFIDRQQEDISTLTHALTTSLSDEERIAIAQEIAQKDFDCIAFLKQQSDILDRYSEKALFQRNMKLFKFVDVLKTRIFLFE